MSEIKKKKVLNREDFPYQWNVVENNWILLSDGTKLSARFWFPETKQPVPAVLEYIPYHKRAGMRGRDEPMHGYFAGHGYAVVRCDIRGSGESDGLLRDEYLLQEQEDALEVIEWISKQPWCSGRVGMMGKSWGGFNSLQVAARQPDALKAIIAVGFTDDRYNKDIHYKGGCLLNDNFWWGNIMFAYQCRPIDPEIAGERWREDWLRRLEEMPLWMGNWMDHPTRDEYWKHGSVCENYKDIKVPVLAIDGWADAYTNSVLSLMEGLGVPRRAVIGPWAHVYPHDGVPAPAMGFLQEAVKWWDHWLKEEKNDAMEGPMVKAWIEDPMPPDSVQTVSEGRWVGLTDVPAEELEEISYSLTYGKIMKQPAEHAEEVVLKTPLNHGLLAGEWMGAGVPGETAADMRMDDGMSMVFDSEILNDSLDVLGDPVFDIELSSDKPNAMLYAQLSDVHPDGAVSRVSYGVMNLTHLKGHDRLTPLIPGERVKVTVRLDCCGHRFMPGHRIRLSLATTFWPMFWIMPEDAALTLQLSTAKLHLPQFKGADAKEPNMNPECAPLTPMTTLSEGRVDRSISYDILTDTWTCITDGVGGVFGEGVYRFDEVDIFVEHNLKREITLSNKDPLSGKYTIYQKMKTGREGWMIESDMVFTMWADRERFYITGNMHVTENGEEAFHKEYDYQTARCGI